MIKNAAPPVCSPYETADNRSVSWLKDGVCWSKFYILWSTIIKKSPVTAVNLHIGNYVYMKPYNQYHN